MIEICLHMPTTICLFGLPSGSFDSEFMMILGITIGEQMLDVYEDTTLLRLFYCLEGNRYSQSFIQEISPFG